MTLRRVQISITMLLLACAAALAACADDIPEAPQEATLRAAPAESAAQQQAVPANDQSEPQTQLETIQALYADWAAQLTSFEMSLYVAVELDDLAFKQSVFLQTQLEPLQLYMEVDLGDLLGAMTGFAGDIDPDMTDGPAVDELLPTTIRMLLVDDRAYLSLSEDGWGAVPASELFGSELSALTGGLSDDAVASMTAQADLALLCAELTGGAAVRDELDGVPVWSVSCTINNTNFEALSALLDSLDTLGQDSFSIPGVPVGETLDAIESLHYTVQIDQRNGAPLAFDVLMTFAGDILGDQEAPSRMLVAAVGRVTAWNQPIDFPTPEPLIEDDGLFE